MTSKTTNGILHLAVARAIPLQLEYRDAGLELRTEGQQSDASRSESQTNLVTESAR